jgi:hypothetical protein
MDNPGRYMKNKTVECVECHNLFQAKRGNQVTCSDPCRKRRAYVMYRRSITRLQRIDDTFYCPKCEHTHATPIDPRGYRYQFCAPCRKGFYEHGWPMDTYSECRVMGGQR